MIEEETAFVMVTYWNRIFNKRTKEQEKLIVKKIPENDDWTEHFHDKWGVIIFGERCLKWEIQSEIDAKDCSLVNKILLPFKYRLPRLLLFHCSIYENYQYNFFLVDCYSTLISVVFFSRNIFQYYVQLSLYKFMISFVSFLLKSPFFIVLRV